MNYKSYPFIPSPNFNDRQNDWNISILVLHYTVLDFENTKKTFLDPDKQASAHYVVDVDGSIYQFVEDEKRAWHAGVSFFDGITDVNSNSIGIEIVNGGYDIDNVTEYPAHPYPEVQMNAVAKLSKEIVRRYDIPPFCVVGHSDIAPGRKIDPGPHLPWRMLHEQGLGLLPNYELYSNQNILNTVPSNQDEPEISRLLSQYGYDVANLSATKRAFQMHFNPAAYLRRQDFGTYDVGMLKDLLWKKYGPFSDMIKQIRMVETYVHIDIDRKYQEGSHRIIFDINDRYVAESFEGHVYYSSIVARTDDTVTIRVNAPQVTIGDMVRVRLSSGRPGEPSDVLYSVTEAMRIYDAFSSWDTSIFQTGGLGNPTMSNGTLSLPNYSRVASRIIALQSNKTYQITLGDLKNEVGVNIIIPNEGIAFNKFFSSNGSSVSFLYTHDDNSPIILELIGSGSSTLNFLTIEQQLY